MKKLTVVLWVAAILVILASLSVFIYTQIPKGDTSKVIICGKDYYWDNVFSDFETEGFTANDEDFEGIPLTALLEDAGVPDPEGGKYAVSASDGYEKTIEWDDFSRGYLVKEKKVTVFPTLAKSFWVRDVIEIRKV
jgi:hypothetical protein